MRITRAKISIVENVFNFNDFVFASISKKKYLRRYLIITLLLNFK